MPPRGTLILVLGLAGSGKSHLISLLKNDFCIEEGFALDEEVNIEKLLGELSKGSCCVISERKYRSTNERAEFFRRIVDASCIAPIIRIICFENDLDSANHNCKVRTNKAHDPSGDDHVKRNKSDSVSYEIPVDAIVVKIHRVSECLSEAPATPPPAISLHQVT